MILFKKNKIFEGAKLRCKVSYGYTHFKIGKEYIISSIFIKNDKHYDVYINGYWFALLFEDDKSEENISIFPLANLYFFTEQEERKIKLQIIDLQSKIKIK